MYHLYMHFFNLKSIVLVQNLKLKIYFLLKPNSTIFNLTLTTIIIYPNNV